MAAIPPFRPRVKRRQAIAFRACGYINGLVIFVMESKLSNNLFAAIGRNRLGECMNRKVMVGLFAGVVALAISNVILGIVATDIYRTYNELRRDPLGLLQARETPAGEYDFLLIGDSLAEQWKIPGYAVVNKGISAQTTGQVRYRMQLFEEGIHAEKSIICVGGERSQNPAR